MFNVNRFELDIIIARNLLNLGQLQKLGLKLCKKRANQQRMVFILSFKHTCITDKEPHLWAYCVSVHARSKIHQPHDAFKVMATNIIIETSAKTSYRVDCS